MMKKLPGDLPDSIVKQIKDYIIKDSELTSETPIGIGVFDLLRKKSTIVFYPLEEEDNDAFLLEKMPSYSGVINFVYINTAKTIEKQVFAAAHELGHLLDISNNINCEEKQDDSNERIVNRFAAELLMPEDLFKKEFVKATYKYVSNNSITLGNLSGILCVKRRLESGVFCELFSAISPLRLRSRSGSGMIPAVLRHISRGFIFGEETPLSR